MLSKTALVRTVTSAIVYNGRCFLLMSNTSNSLKRQNVVCVLVERTSVSVEHDGYATRCLGWRLLPNSV